MNSDIPAWFIISCIIFLLLASLTNLLSLTYIKKTYDTGKSLYFILALDSCSVATTSLAGSIFGVCKDIIGLETGPVTCTLNMMTTSLQIHVSPVLAFVISLIRFKRISLSHSRFWNNDQDLIKWTIMIFICVILYWISWVGANSLTSQDLFMLYDRCLGLQKKNVWILGQWLKYIFLLMPVLACLLLSALLDLNCLKLIQRQANDQMSLRATIVSFAMTLHYFILGFIYVDPFHILGLDEKQTQVLLMLIYFAFLVFRNPLTTTCSFRVNEVNQQVDAKTERERKRQIEIQDALQARAGK